MAAQRYSTKEKASVEVYGRSGNIIASLKDVSLTGACLEWSQEQVELKEGDLVRLTIVLKAINRKHNVSGEVVWRAGNKSGITFIKSQDVIDKLIERDSR